MRDWLFLLGGKPRGAEEQHPLPEGTHASHLPLRAEVREAPVPCTLDFPARRQGVNPTNNLLSCPSHALGP